MKSNKKVIIFFIVILIVVIVGGICFYKRNNNTANDILEEYTPIEEILGDESMDAYIDIWRDTSMDMDIALHSIGSGPNEKLYLGAQPIHYLIDENGEVHTHQASSYRNKKTGKRDPATVEYIKKLSHSELENLEKDLKLIIETNSSDSIGLDSSYWYIQINGKSTRVNVNIQTSILDNYL